MRDRRQCKHAAEIAAKKGQVDQLHTIRDRLIERGGFLHTQAAEALAHYEKVMGDSND